MNSNTCFTANILLLLLSGLLCTPLNSVAARWDNLNQTQIRITHGPVLGQPGAHSMDVWVRTSKPSEYKVSYMSESGQTGTVTGKTALNRDNSGTVRLTDLKSNTRYEYIVSIPNSDSRRSGSFKTMPDPEHYRHPKYNPRGLYNFSFEHGSCNYC